jgi:hypothetical protein
MTAVLKVPGPKVHAIEGKAERREAVQEWYVI